MSASPHRRRVLVVSHEATRTGAPRVAVDVLRALAPDYDTVVVQRWGGPLAGELAAAAGRSRREPFTRLRVLLRRWRRTRRLAVPVETAAAWTLLLRHRPALVWANTVLSACYVRPARRLGIPVVLHVHEVEPMVSTVLDRHRLAGDLGAPGTVVAACSEAARDAVVAACRPAPAVELLLSVPDAERIRRLAGGPAPAGGRTVVSCGTANDTKGVDVWVAAAEAVLARPGTDDVTFVWVGKGSAPVPDAVAGRVRFLGEQENPYPAVAAATVFTLLSRRDSFPLAVLEAMALSRPVVVTDAGGMPRQVGDAGVVVPTGDAGAAAAAIADLLADGARRERLGGQAAARVAGEYGYDAFVTSVRRLTDRLAGSR